MSIRIDGTNTAANPGITGADADTGLQFGTDEVSIVTGGTEKVKVDSSGRLLVNCTGNPSNKNTVTPTAVFDGSGVNGSIQINRHTSPGGGGSQLLFSSTRGSSVTSYTVVQSGDGLGSIDFMGADGGEFVTAAQIQSQVDGTPGDNDMPGRLVFSTTADGASSPTERMRIRSDGNIGINHVGGASAQLYVNGATGTGTSIYGQANGSGSNYAVHGLSTGGNSAQYGVYGQAGTTSTYASAGSLSYSINNNTYGIIGYWSTAAYYSFYGNGNIAGTAFTNVSDSRLKDVDSNLTGCLDKLANIQPVKYTWKENSQQRRSMGEGLEIGLLAQEVQAQFPELVSDMEWPEITGANAETLNEQLGTTLGVDYGRMTAVLIQALNEAKVRIETLETRLTALEGGAS